MEYYSRMLIGVRSDPSFNFHPGCKDLGITHLAFADDIMLFSRGDIPSISLLKESLDRFGATSGLMTNQSKSSVYLAGCSHAESQDILLLTGYTLGQFPFRYLGIPLLSSRLNVQHYAPLIDSLRSLSLGWNLASLSYTGRLELIKTCIQGKMAFWMSIFPMPEAVLRRVEFIMRATLWGKSNRTKFKHLVSWKKICKPKKEGSLGLREMRAWNSALLTSALWDVQRKKDALWIRWVHNKYLRMRDFWSVETNRSDSPLWKSFLSIRDLLKCRLNGEDNVTRKLGDWVVCNKLSTKHVYNILRNRGSNVPWFNGVWVSEIYPRWAFSMWLCAIEKFLTLDRAPFLQLGALCPLCSLHNETHEHLFFECRSTVRILVGVGVLELFPGSCSFKRILEDICKSSGEKRKRGTVMLSAAVYATWKARNESLFEERAHNIPLLEEKAKFLALRALHLAKLF